MFSANIILKSIITLIFIVVTLFTSNYYLFWLLGFYLLLITIVDKNYKALLIDFLIVLILLFIFFTAKIMILVKGLIILCFLVLYLTSFTKRDIWKIKYEEGYKNINSRKRIFVENFKKQIEKNNKDKAAKLNYPENEEALTKKINQDIDDLYMYSKVRFFGYTNTVTSMFGKWNIYDTIYLAVSIIVLLVMYKFWS